MLGPRIHSANISFNFKLSTSKLTNLYPYLPPRIFLIAVWGNWFMYESHFVLDLCLCWRQAYINASLRICYCFSHLIGLFSVTWLSLLYKFTRVFYLWRANAQNVRLYYPCRQYTNHFIFQFAYMYVCMYNYPGLFYISFWQCGLPGSIAKTWGMPSSFEQEVECGKGECRFVDYESTTSSAF